MAFDEDLAGRVRPRLPKGTMERKMFGGIAWMVNGNMALGINKDELMVRVPADFDQHQKHVRPFEMGGKGPMKGFILVAPEALQQAHEIEKWVDRGIHTAQSLPTKKA